MRVGEPSLLLGNQLASPLRSVVYLSVIPFMLSSLVQVCSPCQVQMRARFTCLCLLSRDSAMNNGISTESRRDAGPLSTAAGTPSLSLCCSTCRCGIRVVIVCSEQRAKHRVLGMTLPQMHPSNCKVRPDLSGCPVSLSLKVICSEKPCA